MDLPPLSERPLVSVLTAACDYERYVGDAVRSVLGQHYPHLEHVVVDDGSRDGTADVVAALAATDPRLRLVRGPNGGQTAALNRAWALARGEVVLFLDADDRFHPDKIDRVLAALRAHPRAGMLSHKLQEVDADGRPLDVYPPLSSLASGWQGERALADGGVVIGLSATSGLALRRAVAEQIFPLPDGVRAADEVIMGLAPLVTELVGVDDALVDYRWHGANLTRGDGDGWAEIDRRLATHTEVWELQRAFLGQLADPGAAAALTPLDRSRYVAELRYARARLAGDDDAPRRHRALVDLPTFAAQPRVRRLFWEGAPLLPDPVFARLHAELSHPGPARRAVRRATEVAGVAATTRSATRARWRSLRDRIAYQLDPRVDRHVLEQGIFPAIHDDPTLVRVLFVGCEWYTKDYPGRFPAGTFQTIDIDPAKARYGSDDHLVGSVTDLGDHVDDGSFDVVVCSGVIGFGLQEQADAERAVAACHRALRPGGWLVLGWNDVEDLCPFAIDDLEALRAFDAVPLPPFPSARYPTFSPARHTFDFYRRPGVPAPTAPHGEGCTT